MNLTEREPLAIRAAITAAVTAIVHVAAVYDLVDADQEAAIGAAIDAAGLIVLILWARPGVTANAKVIAQVTTEGEVVAGEAAAVPTGESLPVRYVLAGRVLDAVEVKPELVDQAA